MRVLAEFRRDTARSVNGFPQANMFDQPEFEALLRTNLKRYPHARSAATSRSPASPDQRDGRVGSRSPIAPTAASSVEADYVLGCDGANSVVRAEIGAAHARPEVRRSAGWSSTWPPTPISTSGRACTRCAIRDRAATYMRIGETRYRWEFRLLPGETADDFQTSPTLEPLIAPWTGRHPRRRRWSWSA